ncbi:MAG: TIGR01212 family radical SAM protein [FCB group bacterium]|nr:TIGR01212 family radical SAM protein [FCB group bacterium]
MTVLPYARRGFHYNSYKYYLEDRFGERVQRISLQGGFTCPNRDGTLSKAGCIYCNESSFSPPYADKDLPLSEQFSEGIRFLKERFGAHKFIAYFQNYTNTYAAVNKLEALYREALSHPDVVGLAVSTRPDCISDDVLSLLSDISGEHDVNLEIGVESLYDRSLEWMNRCHTLKTTLDTLERIAKYSLDVTAHIILGLPTETHSEMMGMRSELNRLPIKFLKIHHLQVISGTQLARIYKKTPFALFSYREYLEFIAHYISGLRPELILQRVISSAPGDCLIAPKWGQTTTAFVMDLQKYMREHNLYQGDQAI